jgi:hypothetical protein
MRLLSANEINHAPMTKGQWWHQTHVGKITQSFSSMLKCPRSVGMKEFCILFVKQTESLV